MALWRPAVCPGPGTCNRRIHDVVAPRHPGYNAIMTPARLAAFVTVVLLALPPNAVASGAPPAYVAAGRAGAVAAEHRLASRAGVEMLEAGGNAIDAAVAAALVTGVVNPSSSGLGGGGFAIVYLAGPRRAHVLDYRERAGRAAHRDMYLRDGALMPGTSRKGGLAVAVPGEPAGLSEALQRWGTLPMSRVAAPAVRAARDGFTVEDHLAHAIAAHRDDLAGDPAMAFEFLHEDGSPYATGQTLRRPRLAATLETLATEGAAPFYEGAIAADIIASVRAAGGSLEAADFTDYRVVSRDALISNYRGFKVVGMPPPSSGGATIAAALELLEGYDLAALGQNSTTYLHLLAEVLKPLFADRATVFGDPDHVQVPLARLLSPTRLDGLRQRIRFSEATPAERYGNARAAEDSGTSHISVVDADGNAVALTTSVNTGFGALLGAGERGIVLNNTMDDFSVQPGVPNAFGLVGTEANAVAAGKRPLSSMSPTIVLRQGRARLVAGASGGPLIITATLQTIVNVLDFAMEPGDAVSAPRIHHQWRPDILGVEPGIAATTRTSLERLGHKVMELPARASVQIVEVSGGGRERRVRAVADPRKGGVAAAY